LLHTCQYNVKYLVFYISCFNGTIIEAELHVLRARLRGGIVNKARRGKLWIMPPVGLVYNDHNEVILDPDKQVQQSLHLLFETYHRTGSATATVKSFRQQGLLFPRRLRKGPRPGELVWGELGHSQTLRILHNPRYAGTFVFGRSKTRKNIDGSATVKWLPRDQWDTLIPDNHAGYISWEEFEENQRRFRETAQACGKDRRKSPPREGPALLQGLAVCGLCGNRMTVRYNVRKGRPCSEYVCQKEGIECAERICQQIPGVGIEQTVGDLLIEAMSPVALDVALAVQEELQSRVEEAERLRQTQVERARYEAELAQRRYLRVDPDNRLVADTLEADWNRKLCALDEAKKEYERKREADRLILNKEERKALFSLVTDFPRLWRDPHTSDRDRKRMVRLLIEDVTLTRDQKITLRIRFKGGAHKSIMIPLSPNAWQQRLTPQEVVEEIDRFLGQYYEVEIAEILNKRGYRSGEGCLFNASIVCRIRSRYGLKSRFDRMREAGLLTVKEMAHLLAVSEGTVKTWKNHGILTAHAYNDRDQCLYEHPGDDPPSKMQGKKLIYRMRFHTLQSDHTNEVQYET
jgi:hypothetical protein